MADCSMVSSRLRMLVNDGLLWALGLQHSERRETRADQKNLLLFFYIIVNLAEVVYMTSLHKEVTSLM